MQKSKPELENQIGGSNNNAEETVDSTSSGSTSGYDNKVGHKMTADDMCCFLLLLILFNNPTLSPRLS